MILKPNEKEVTRISPHAKIKGSLSSEGDIVIEGEFEGHIKTTAHVHIGKGAKVVSSAVHGELVRVDGVLGGKVKATSTLEIGAGGVITGDVECLTLAIGQGAILNGQCMMLKKEHNIAGEGVGAATLLKHKEDLLRAGVWSWMSAKVRDTHAKT